MLNPKLLFLLVINLAVLALNFAEFADGTEDPALTNDVTHIEANNNSVAAETMAVAEPPRAEKQTNDKITTKRGHRA